VERLPLVNASLNACATVLLIIGWRRVKRGDVAGHKRMMLLAVAVSSAFLACYVTYHYAHGHTTFTRGGFARIVYLTILATHVPLAALMVIPIIILVALGLTGRITAHKRLARFVLPVWLYVSVTGVVIYVLLYHVWPAA